MELGLASVFAVVLLQQTGAPIPAFWLVDRLSDLGGLALLVLGAVLAFYVAYRLLDRLRIETAVVSSVTLPAGAEIVTIRAKANMKR